MIELKNITFGYNDTKSKKGAGSLLFENFNLVINNNKTVIAGPSGSGKSTLAKIIIGESQPFKGEVIKESSIQKITFLFQNNVKLLNPYRKTEEQLKEVKKVTRDKTGFDENHEYLLNNAGIDETYLTKYAGSLSGGERQRVALIRQLLFVPDLLILDEPFSAQDSEHKKKLSRVIHEFSNMKNIKLIIISHELEYLYDLCDDFIILNDGKVEDRGTKAYILNESGNKITMGLTGRAVKNVIS